MAARIGTAPIECPTSLERVSVPGGQQHGVTHDKGRRFLRVGEHMLNQRSKVGHESIARQVRVAASILDRRLA